MSRKRPDGDGTVRKRKDGRWEGRIVIGHKDDGTPIFKSVFAKTQKELMPKLHTAINEYRGVDISEKGNMTLGEWMDRWIEEYAVPTLRSSTVSGYTRDINNHIRPALGEKQIRFHDLRHTFATTALEHGMDIKTLSAIIGHISSATTIDIYSHITDTMQLQAANKIERGIGKNEAYEPHETSCGKVPAESAKTPKIAEFEPYKGKIRKSGTGGIYQINDRLFEGRYTPTNAHGKREVHTVYAKTAEECEKMLEQMIIEVRAKIKAGKERLKVEMTAERKN